MYKKKNLSSTLCCIFFSGKVFIKFDSIWYKIDKWTNWRWVFTKKKTTCFLLPQQTSRKGVAEAPWKITATRNVPSSLRLTGRRNLKRRLIFLGEVEKHCSWIWISARRTGKPPPCHLKKTRTKGVTDEAQVPGWIGRWLVCSFIPHQSQLVVAPQWHWCASAHRRSF